MAKPAPPATMKSPVRAALRGRPGPASQELFTEEYPQSLSPSPGGPEGHMFLGLMRNQQKSDHYEKSIVISLPDRAADSSLNVYRDGHADTGWPGARRTESPRRTETPTALRCVKDRQIWLDIKNRRSLCWRTGCPRSGR